MIPRAVKERHSGGSRRILSALWTARPASNNDVEVAARHPDYGQHMAYVDVLGIRF